MDGDGASGVGVSAFSAPTALTDEIHSRMGHLALRARFFGLRAARKVLRATWWGLGLRGGLWYVAEIGLRLREIGLQTSEFRLPADEIDLRASALARHLREIHWRASESGLQVRGSR